MASHLKKLTVFISAVLSLSCATSAPVSLGRLVLVTSNPPFATCKFIGDPTVYRTPFSVTLNPARNYLMRVEKEGYQPAMVEVWRPTETLVSIPGAGSESGLYKPSTQAPPVFGPRTIDVALKPVATPIPPVVEAAPPPAQPLPPSPVVEKHASGLSKEKALAKELDDIYRLKRQGKITAKEYAALKKKIIDRF